MAGPLATIVGLGAATVAVSLRDPHVQGSWGLCPSAALGFWCPGCGGLRAVWDLTHLQVAAAASSNLLFVLGLPLVLFFLGRWLLDSWTGTVRTQNLAVSQALLVVALGGLAVFTVLRNVPGLGWLAP